MSRIVVLTGGSTPERDVAFAGAAQVAHALRASGHTVSVVDTVTGPLNREGEAELLEPPVGKLPPSAEQLRNFADTENLPQIAKLEELHSADVIFLILHGHQGEGGILQALLDEEGLLYTGSGADASALAMDKDRAKQLFRVAGIPVQPWCMWPASSQEIAELGFPLIVKPSRVGSSVGMTIVRSDDELEPAVEIARAFDEEIMLEMFLPGREFTVGVLGGRALAVGEILPKHELFDYECKYTPGMTDEIFPADIDPAVRDQLRDYSLAAHEALGLRDFSRVDFKEDAAGVAQCLEVNTLPGLTVTSLLPQSAGAVGISFPDLCEEICNMALARARKGNKDGS